MASLPTSPSISFLDASGNEIERPLEWIPAYLCANIPLDAWEDIVLTVQDYPQHLMLRKFGGITRVVAEWPRSGTGHYRIALSGPHEAQLLVTITPQKISDSSYKTMLCDLESRLPAAVAIALQRLGGFGGLSLKPPTESTIAEEFARLKRAVDGTPGRPGLVTVLARLASDPHHVLKTDEVWVPRERSRRPLATRLVRVMTAPNNLAGSGSPLRVIDQRSMTTYDVYENQLLLLFRTLVSLRLRRLEHMARTRPSGTLLNATRVLQADLNVASRQAPFLDEVSLLHHLPTQLTMVLLRRPEYFAVLEGYLELQRSLAVRFEHPALESPLKELPTLYQLWGTMEIMANLLDVADRFGYRLESQRVVRRTGHDIFVEIVPDGKEIVTLTHPLHDTRIRLIPECSFHSSGPLHSVSFTQIPDMVIEVRPVTGATRLYLFDPKYKLDGELLEDGTPDGKPKKVDIDKMHAYRDAIRDVSGNRVVESAVTLYPGPSVHYGPGLGAIQAIPGQSDRLANYVTTILEDALGADR